MANIEKKFLGIEAVEQLVKNTREEIKTGDEATLAAAKKHAENLGVNYDPAGTAQTKVNELANGAVKTNTEAIAKLNGDASTDGSVAKAVADAKALVDADVEALEGRMDTVEADIGDVDKLETTAKTLAEAVNEVRNAVSAGGVSAAVTMDTATTTEGMAKSYTLKQGENVIGTIDIPKDMVVESGEVVTLADGEVAGHAAGTYIKLVLANANNDVIYVNVGTLVDIYKAQANATQIQLAINSATREISATIVAGSVTATELAADAVTTVKIADGNVTKAKLSAAVQASLDKADASATQAALEEEVNRAKAAEKANADAISAIKDHESVDSFADVMAEIAKKQDTIPENTYDAYGAAAQALTDAKAHTNELANGAVKANTDAIAAIKNGDKIDSFKDVEDELAGFTEGLSHVMGIGEDGSFEFETDAFGVIPAINEVNAQSETNAADIDKLEASLAEGGATANAIADAKKAGTDASAAITALEEGEVANLRTDVDALKAVSYVEITADEIDAMFETA